MTASTGYGRRTIYRGIPMRSRTEASCARWLDHVAETCPHTWRYEPECFAGPAGDYLPDFYEWQGCVGLGAYIEIKPWKSPDYPFDNRAEYEGYMRRMEIIRDTHPGAVLILLPWSWHFVPASGERWEPRHGPRVYFRSVAGRGWTVEHGTTSQGWQ